ncbi:MAG: aspartate/glutamate racemase [Elusimicrobia bacterium CG_4_10_14_0_2_um_filter_56_8]|nr:MAG: aspartate/glutamate racemase [Elusimicrobia bacterium CG1_02_56_21]PJA17573.1 MAG: aspartate/glutamate racemase [Elusimicrobia bacterium CG_4_10_14_0_2_um_filter_56_8]
MKTLGLIGGLSWFSTAVYYETINRIVGEKLGGGSSAKLILYSVDFKEFKALLDAGNWGQIELLLSGIAGRLEKAGADCLMMCSNTPHVVAELVKAKIGIPLLNIAEETAREIAGRRLGRVALLGTKFTMEQPFFKESLLKYGIQPVIPCAADRESINSSIFKELTKGVFRAETRAKYQAIIEALGNEGAEGVIFGCTEISRLISGADCRLPVFDTTAIHCKAAADFSLS